MKWKAYHQALFAASWSRTLDWSSIQAFRRWKPYLVQFLTGLAIPESSAPWLKQEKVRLRFIAKELALFELFLRNNSRNSRDRQVFWCLSMEEALFRITITSANFLQARIIANGDRKRHTEELPSSTQVQVQLAARQPPKHAHTPGRHAPTSKIRGQSSFHRSIPPFHSTVPFHRFQTAEVASIIS